MNMPDIEIQMFQWLGRAPWVLVACAGIVLCMVFSGKHPRRCLLVGSALAIKLGTYAAAPFITPLLFRSLDASNMSELNWRILLNDLIYAFPNALALGLLLWAVFEPMWRTEPRSDQPE